MPVTTFSAGNPNGSPLAPTPMDQFNYQAGHDWMYQQYLNNQLANQRYTTDANNASSLLQNGSFGDKSAYGMAQLGAEGANQQALQGVINKGAVDVANTSGQYGIGQAQIAAAPAMARASLDSTMYGDTRTQVQAEAQAAAGKARFMGSIYDSINGGGPPAAGGASGAPGSGGGFQLSSMDRSDLARGALGLGPSSQHAMLDAMTKMAMESGDSEMMKGVARAFQTGDISGIPMTQHVDQRSLQDAQGVLSMPNVANNLRQIESYLGNQDLGYTQDNIDRVKRMVNSIRQTAAAMHVSPRAQALIEQQIQQSIHNATNKSRDVQENSFLPAIAQKITGAFTGNTPDSVDQQLSGP